MGLIINSLPEIDKVYTDHIQALNDPKLRQEYQDLCFDLHLPCPSAYWTLETRIKDKLIERKRQPAGSWTRNFWNWLASTQLYVNSNHATSFGAGYISWKSTAGVVGGSTTAVLRMLQGVSYVDLVYDAVAGYGVAADVTTNYGILAGTGSTAFSIENFAMETLIANGTGSGQFSYQSMIASTWSWTVGTLTMNFNRFRYMNNNSGGDITVEEIGLVARSSSPSLYILLERHITGGLLVPNTAQLKAEYDTQMVYPS